MWSKILTVYLFGLESEKVLSSELVEFLHTIDKTLIPLPMHVKDIPGRTAPELIDLF